MLKYFFNIIVIINKVKCFDFFKVVCDLVMKCLNILKYLVDKL